MHLYISYSLQVAYQKRILETRIDEVVESDLRLHSHRLHVRTAETREAPAGIEAGTPVQFRNALLCGYDDGVSMLVTLPQPLTCPTPSSTPPSLPIHPSVRGPSHPPPSLTSLSPPVALGASP